MKFKNTTPDYPAFQPVTIEFTFETQQEVDMMFTLLNRAYLSDAVAKVYGIDSWGIKWHNALSSVEHEDRGRELDTAILNIYEVRAAGIRSWGIG